MLMSEEKLKDKTDNEFFVPLEAQEDQLPASVTAADEPNAIPETLSFKLQPRGSSSLKVLGISVATLLLGTFTWEVSTKLQSLFEFSTTAGVAASSVIAFIVYKALRAGFSLWHNQREFARARNLRDDAEKLRAEQAFGQAQPLLKALRKLYRGKPQDELLTQALDQLPDYANDRETVDHLSTAFLSKLDEAALQRISSYAQQTAVMVAVSPLASMDMLIAFWRSARMVDEISQIYGYRPSLLGRWMLMKKLLHQLAFTGLTEIISDRLATLPSNRMLGIVSAAGAQGLGAGIYTARIGLYTMRECRPVPFQKEERPRLGDIMRNIADFMKRNTAADDKDKQLEN
jgi:putative membrane protein